MSHFPCIYLQPRLVLAPQEELSSRDLIVREIYTTEATYVAQLKTITEVLTLYLNTELQGFHWQRTIRKNFLQR